MIHYFSAGKEAIAVNEKLLIVDDEKGVVDMLKSYFEMRSFQVYTAHDGKGALKQVAHNPDLVLLDINMPGMNGLTVCEKIRDYITRMTRASASRSGSLSIPKKKQRHAKQKSNTK